MNFGMINWKQENRPLASTLASTNLHPRQGLLVLDLGVRIFG